MALKLLTTIDEAGRYSAQMCDSGFTVGLVPTMGALHEGHLSLVRLAKRVADRVIVSIFVNPTQFSADEDLEKYPRNLEQDLALLRKEGVRAVFHPGVEAMYSDGFSTSIRIEGSLTRVLCGARRQGHFNGVATVVTKLFTILRPHLAVFGQKDYQQLLVIRRLVEDLNLDVKIIPAPIVREEDGLAMSSRNRYLSIDERQQAKELNAALRRVRERYDAGERSAAALAQSGIDYLTQLAPHCRLDYFDIRHPATLATLEQVEEAGAVVAVAGWLGTTRLIDNIVLT